MIWVELGLLEKSMELCAFEREREGGGGKREILEWKKEEKRKENKERK